ncbi:sugar transferase, partial [Candidatus Woesearchaeota archaeon]|nr:sugar transferase [Candidatus Woesearchaeota archaeon]
GLNGVPIQVYKIRTMHSGSDKLKIDLSKQKIVDSNGSSVEDNRRIESRRWLRRWGIDEWPQLYNILEGEMSLVGLRPREEYYLDQLDERYKGYKNRVLQYKPGLFPPERIEKNTGSLDDFVKRGIAYLDKKDVSSIRTDFVYFFKIMYSKIIERTKNE